VPVFRPHPRAIGTPRVVPTPAEMPAAWRAAWPWAFWLVWGVWLAVSDMRAAGVQSAVIKLVVGAAILGASRPRTWWFWSLALAAWIPAESVLNALFRLGLALETNLGSWLLALVFSTVGSFLGRSIALAVRERGPR